VASIWVRLASKGSVGVAQGMLPDGIELLLILGGDWRLRLQFLDGAIGMGGKKKVAPAAIVTDSFTLPVDLIMQHQNRLGAVQQRPQEDDRIS
jgi:hypothetical protein